MYTAICPTKGRSTVTSRAIRCFLEQDFEGDALLLIYNNSEVKQELAPIELPPNRKILLINNHLSLETGEPYKDLGTIYQDIIQYVPEETEFVSHFECDDIYLPSYITHGVEGLKRNNCDGWKSKKSWFKTAESIVLAENVLEPSMFFRWSKVKEVGYEPITGCQFHKLINSIDNFVIEDVDFPQFMYCWDGEFDVFKTSGAIDDVDNFMNYEKHSQDHGNGILTPWTKQQYEDIFNKSKFTYKH